MDKRIAIVFGSTGLVGKALIQELRNNDTYSSVIAFVRNKGEWAGNDKIIEKVIDFDDIKSYSDLIEGNDLFICLGTTIRKAGSVRRMEEIDRDLPVTIAGIAAAKSVEKIAVISSVGADPQSSNYYLRIKGEMEEGIMKQDFRRIAVLRPSLLLGKRGENRPGEVIGKFLFSLTGIFLVGKLAKYRAIKAADVAKAMIKALEKHEGKEILESDSLMRMAQRLN